MISLLHAMSVPCWASSSASSDHQLGCKPCSRAACHAATVLLVGIQSVTRSQVSGNATVGCRQPHNHDQFRERHHISHLLAAIKSPTHSVRLSAWHQACALIRPAVPCRPFMMQVRRTNLQRHRCSNSSSQTHQLHTHLSTL